MRKGVIIDIIAFVVIATVVSAISFGLAWAVGTSDLPDWLKFYFLKNM